jgi:hypothetical protein
VKQFAERATPSSDTQRLLEIALEQLRAAIPVPGSHSLFDKFAEDQAWRRLARGSSGIFVLLSIPYSASEKDTRGGESTIWPPKSTVNVREIQVGA